MQIIEISSWVDYKALISNKKLLIQFEESDSWYRLYAPEAESFLWNTALQKGTEDANDFETNFKADANTPLETKATASAPLRVVPTAQPGNTTEKWRGYHTELAASDLVKTILINFPIDVFLRGGLIYSDDCSCKDYFTVDVVWTTYPAMVIYPNLLETIYMLPNMQIPFISAECMKFPTMLSLQITYHKFDDGKDRCISAIANFFEPPQV